MSSRSLLPAQAGSPLRAVFGYRSRAKKKPPTTKPALAGVSWFTARV